MEHTKGTAASAPAIASSGEVAVQTQEIAKRYARTWALKGVDLTVQRGELVSLLGPNGSGKSTLLRIITSVTRPTYGTVTVFGSEPRSSDEVRGRMGVLPADSYLYGELTALENLTFAATMYGIEKGGAERRDALRAALAGVGLEHVADGEVRTFSSGMRKRLALARATLHDPDLVLLDEPYGALDVEGIAWVDRFVTRLRAAGKTLIIATHEIGRALALCDRAVALRRGRVEFDGPASEYRGAVSGATEVVEMQVRRP